MTCNAELARRPPQGLVHHSDRGSQYASGGYQAELQNFDIVGDMSRKGNCWDNAVAESFFSTLKTEMIGGKIYKSRSEARADIFEYIEIWYNRQRRHSTLGYLSPTEFEQQAVVSGQAKLCVHYFGGIPEPCTLLQARPRIRRV